MKVLVVDDEPIIRLAAATAFSDAGATVLQASDGHEALSLFAHNPDIGLVFSDVRMPGMSGYALAATLRERAPNLRIVLTTAYADTDDAVQEPVIRKPWTPEQLQVLISTPLRGVDMVVRPPVRGGANSVVEAAQRPATDVSRQGEEEGAVGFVTRALTVNQSAAARYGLAVGLATAALVARAFLSPIIGQGPATFGIFLAVVMSALVGGVGPGILATLFTFIVAVVSAREFSLSADHLRTLVGPSTTYAALCAILIGAMTLVRRSVAGTHRARENLRNLFAQMDQGFILYQAVRTTPGGRFDDLVRLQVNQAAIRMGLPPAAIKTSLRQSYAELGSDWIAPYLKVAETGQSAKLDWVAPATGRHFEVELYSPTPGQCAALLTDVTHRRRQQELRDLMIREVEHRSKNLLSVILSLAQLGRGEPEAFDRLIARIHAIARSQNAFLTAGDSGVGIREIATQELEAFLHTPEQSPEIFIDGPPVTFSAQQAQAIGMILHELATNAAKHGGLRGHHCRTSLTWTVAADGLLEITWAEFGAADCVVALRPAGFGTKLIDALVGGQLLGDLRRTWRKDGLEVVIRMKLSSGAEDQFSADGGHALAS